MLRTLSGYSIKTVVARGTLKDAALKHIRNLMGIDSAVLNFSTNMFDQKAKLFENGWLYNQVTDQNTMNFAVSNVNGAPMPTGLSALPVMRESLESGNISTNRLPSDSRSYSTDTSNDPTPDGPGMEYGNGNCLTPQSDSVCLSPAEFDDHIYPNGMGTPNSFVTEQMPLSPDMFCCNTNRQRQLSANSAMFTYSPYNAAEDEFIPLGQSCTTPQFNRQTSLAMVEEVLGTTNVCDERVQLFPCEDSPLLNDEEDSCMPPYPSPTFSAHFNANSDLALGMNMSSSQGEEFYDQFCNSEINGLQCDGSPLNTDSNKNDCNNAESENVQSPAQEVVVSHEVAQPTSSFLNVPSMSRQPSNFSDIFTDSMPSNSLDTQEMLQDCLKTLPSSQEANSKTSFQTINLKVLSIQTCIPQSEIPPERKDVHFSSSPPQSIECDKPTISGAKSRETDVTAARRERNNAACRESRKRRRNKKLEMESEINRLASENVELAGTIEELEVECKRVKRLILEEMTKNSSR